MNNKSLLKMFDKHSGLVESLGGYFVVEQQLLIQQLYISLNMRTKKEVEKVERFKSSQLFEFRYMFDLYTTTGIAKLNIPPHSYFDCKNNIVSDTIYRITEFAKKHKEKYPGSKVYLLYKDSNCLSPAEISKTRKQKIIEVHQFDDFLKIINRYAKENESVEKYEKNWKNDRVTLLDSAKYLYHENYTTFFLGAGVSMDAGGPSWKELLQSIMRRFKKLKQEKDFDKIFNWCGMSPIILGRYIASDDSIMEQVTEYLKTKVLYKNIQLSKSELINSICDAIDRNYNADILVDQCQLSSIITYNYDDLVETALECRHIKVARIYEKSSRLKGEFPVYHVHGLIPQKSEGIISTPILREQEYHKVYKESYHWSNVEQLHALDRNTCFFIGMSMTDPNLRRLLDISMLGSDRDCKHFAFLQRKSLFAETSINKNTTHYDTIESQLANLGVRVIWYEDHSEVPNMIRYIISSN